VAELPSVESYLEGRNADAVGLFRQFQAVVDECGPSQPAPTTSIVYRRPTTTWDPVPALPN
jgi:hypothetical protein